MTTDCGLLDARISSSEKDLPVPTKGQNDLPVITKSQ